MVKIARKRAVTVKRVGYARRRMDIARKGVHLDIKTIIVMEVRPII